MINHVKSNKMKISCMDIISYTSIFNKMGNEVTLFNKENNQWIRTCNLIMSINFFFYKIIRLADLHISMDMAMSMKINKSFEDLMQ